MKISKIAMLGLSVLVCLIGLIWMGQGAGIIMYPPESFMLNQAPWIWRGGLVALAGAVGIWWARRM